MNHSKSRDKCGKIFLFKAQFLEKNPLNNSQDKKSRSKADICSSKSYLTNNSKNINNENYSKNITYTQASNSRNYPNIHKKNISDISIADNKPDRMSKFSNFVFF
jgi:hypothetical protein